MKKIRPERYILKKIYKLEDKKVEMINNVSALFFLISSAICFLFYLYYLKELELIYWFMVLYIIFGISIVIYKEMESKEQETNYYVFFRKQTLLILSISLVMFSIDFDFIIFPLILTISYIIFALFKKVYVENEKRKAYLENLK